MCLYSNREAGRICFQSVTKILNKTCKMIKTCYQLSVISTYSPFTRKTWCYVCGSDIISWCFSGKPTNNCKYCYSKVHPGHMFLLIQDKYWLVNVACSDKIPDCCIIPTFHSVWCTCKLLWMDIFVYLRSQAPITAMMTFCFQVDWNLNQWIEKIKVFLMTCWLRCFNSRLWVLMIMSLNTQYRITQYPS